MSTQHAQVELCDSEERSRLASLAMQDLAAQNTQLLAASAEREAELLERLQLSATLAKSAQQQLDLEKVLYKIAELPGVPHTTMGLLKTQRSAINLHTACAP